MGIFSLYHSNSFPQTLKYEMLVVTYFFFVFSDFSSFFFRLTVSVCLAVLLLIHFPSSLSQNSNHFFFEHSSNSQSLHKLSEVVSFPRNAKNEREKNLLGLVFHEVKMISFPPENDKIE